MVGRQLTTLIVAYDQNRTIGHQGRLPWHLPDDLKHFKELTLGHSVVMGRNTWESLPERFRPLPQRLNIVVSTTLPLYQGHPCWVSSNLLEAITLAHTLQPTNQIFLIGGAKLYESAFQLEIVQKVIASVLPGVYVGDTFFPQLPPGFQHTRTTPRQGFSVEEFEKVSTPLGDDVT